jgi:hypothetical protein
MLYLDLVLMKIAQIKYLQYFNKFNLLYIYIQNNYIKHEKSIVKII